MIHLYGLIFFAKKIFKKKKFLFHFEVEVPELESLQKWKQLFGDQYFILTSF